MENIDRAKQIISEIIYITIASVSKEGLPWNTPVYSAFDSSYNFFWASDKNGQHSQNVRNNPNVFLVIYTPTAPEGTGKGVYVKAKAVELTDEAEIKRGIALLYSRKGQDPAKRKPDEFLGEYPRRIYKAVPEKFWINGKGDVNGNYIDTRAEINLV